MVWDMDLEVLNYIQQKTCFYLSYLIKPMAENGMSNGEWKQPIAGLEGFCNIIL